MASSEALLKNLFQQGSSTASSFGQMGKDTLSQVTEYFKNLLGSRSAAMGAAAPEINSVRASADASKKQQSEKGTSRTGGDVAHNQQIEDEVRKAIETLIGQTRQNAAGALGNIGQQELNTMLSALGITTQGVQSDVASQRAASAEMWSSLIGGAGKVIGAVI
jgi:DNA replication initiation complex subunit (GINS family)